MIPLVLATTNVHKVREYRLLFKETQGFDLLSLRDFPHYVPPEETGSSFEENAEIKAIHAAKELKRWALADDSGLSVPSLKGAPGIFSARYAGKDATDLDNRKKLLEQMRHLEGEDRVAFFECVITLASPQGTHKSARGTCEGYLLKTERGGGGFGYDPLFVKHEYNKTFAELDEELKNRISHRRKAFEKLRVALHALSD
jgi:XTP/dITP diphosphohydrolase